MSVALLDVNVLLALNLPQHSKFKASRDWFLAQRGGAWATCPFTEAGFIRIASNSRITPNAGTVAQALEALRRLRATRGHHFWPAGFSPSDEPLFASLQGHRQITDAYLLTLALRHKGRLVTFDGGIQVLAESAGMPPGCVELLPT